jgi:surfeit locus 1 family protein
VKRRVLLSLLGLCLVLGFSALGRWQLGREQVKREQLAAAAAALAAPAVALERATGQGDGIQRVAGRARFLETPRLLLDNQRRGQRVGMRLYCAAQPASGAPLLVDLGWLPVDGARTLPVADCPRGEHVLAGLLVPPPSVGLRLGPGLVAQDRDWLAMRIETAAVSAAWSLPAALSPRVLRLDPALPLGHERDLDLHANTLPPEKHRGYALQWFGLAATTFVLILVLNLRRRP